MKQKLLNDVLYVYSLEPYVITKDIQASVIYVQEELFDEYKALNPELTQLAKKNFNLIAVIEPEWNEFIHEKVDPDFGWPSDTYTAQIGETNIFPQLMNEDDVNVSYTSSDTDIAVISNTGELTLVSKGTCVITASYQGDAEWFNAKSESYSLKVLAAKVNYIFESFNSDGTVKYGEGEAQSTGIETPTMIEIEVISNHSTDPNAADFVGQKFYIQNDAAPDNDVLYPLYDGNGTEVGISVKVNKTNKLDADLYWSESTATVQVGETNIFPTLINNCDVEVSFSSSDDTVATIDANGDITLVSGGTTIISAVFAGDNMHAAETQTYTLTVLQQKVSPNLSWSVNPAVVQLGEANPYFPTLSNPYDVSLTYASNDNSVASVSASGVINLKAEGEAIITATHGGSTYYLPQSVSVSLRVLRAKQSPNISWSSNSATAQVGEENVFPTLSNSNNVEVVYSSSDTDIASFDENNEIVLKQAGQVTITATHNGSLYFNSQDAEYTLTVLAAKVSPNITWSNNSATVQIGETNTFPTLINTNNVEISYISSDTGVATIASNGTITLTGAGTTTISASFVGNTVYSAQTETYELTVLAAKQNANIAWSENSATVQIGETNTFPVLSNPNNLQISYSSTDTSIASIDANGDITLGVAGQVTIEASFSGSIYYNSASVSYTLTVLTAKTNPLLEWSESVATVRIGDVNVFPYLNNPDSLNILYSSSDNNVATIDSTGAISLIGAGTAYITATFSGSQYLNAKQVYYTLTVIAASALRGYALTETLPTAQNLDEYINLNASKPSAESIDMTDLTGPTEFYLIYPVAWEVIENDFIEKPVITDDANGGEIGIWFESQDPKITVSGKDYRIANIQLGKGTFTIEF